MVLQSRRTASLSSFPFLPASPSLPTVSSSSSAAARLPPTYRRLLAVLILAVPAIWYWSSSPSTTSSVLPLAEERSIALSTLVGMAEAELATKQRAHALDDATGLDWDHAALGITLTEEEITLSAYQKSIRDTLRDVFGWTGGSLAMADDVDADGSPLDSSSDDPSPPHLAPPPSQLNTALDWWIASTLAHISLYQDPHHHLSPTSPSPHELFTTSSSTKLSSQFSMWKTLHPETSLRYFDQPSIDSWVKATFPSGLLAREWGRMEAAPRTKKDRRLLDAVRQDMWKALVVLQRAGMTVYADSDTGSVRPFGEWGKNDATSLTMPLLSLLPTLTAIPTNGEGMGEAKERPPSLVLSIEYDVTAGDEGWDRNTFDRGIQFALWVSPRSSSVYSVFYSHLTRTFSLIYPCVR